MKTVYLAGAIADSSHADCLDWRGHIKQLLKCPTIDPMVRNYRGRELEEFVAVVKNDKVDIDACDILLGNYCQPTAGTIMEILYAWERGKIVVLVASSSYQLSPWLLYHSHKLFFGLEEAAAYINSHLLREQYCN